MSRINAFWRTLRAFTRAKGANVAMMFGLSLLPLAVAAGAGLDYAQAMMVRSQMMDALDAAALAVGGQPNLTSAQAQPLAQSVFDANYKGPGHPTVTPAINNQSVSVTATDNVATTALALIGQQSISVSASSIVVWGQTKLWVSLVLDNTGSMTQADSTGLSKIAALKDASHQLLAKLQTAAASGNPGDVQVAIIPFAKDVNVGTANVSATWLDWSDWNIQYSTAPASSVGAGSNCPLGLGCISAPGSTTSATKVPSSGLICPDSIGSSTTGQSGHYYDGCYSSIQQNKVTVTTAATPVTNKQACKTISNVNAGVESCAVNSGYPKNGTVANSSTVSYTPNYIGDSTTATAPAITNINTVNNPVLPGTCTTTKGVKTCTWTRTITSTSTVITTANTASGIYDHAWVINDHSVWRGCVMDRNQNDDTTSATPGNKFPTEQSDSCSVATVMPLNYKWDKASSGLDDNLSAKIDSMVANGGTNQTIGLAHGMQIQMEGDPYNAIALPANTTRYIILLSDGLNTMDRWYGDGSNQSAQVDARMALACTNAKNQGFIIYTLFVDIAGAQGNSTVLKNCATDTSKYYDLTSSSAIITAFNDIAQKITNLRVSR
ncbi:MAG: pilus assembly protein TadG-related protein [Rhizomicrobium sp.]